jgi:3-oxoacyl-[acyl-carrier-protein] synthase III
MEKVKVCGTGHAVPQTLIPNSRLAELFGPSTAGWARRLGIHQRYWGADPRTGRLAAGASLSA